MHPETSDSLVSLHSRFMWSALMKHFQHNWRIHSGLHLANHHVFSNLVCSNFYHLYGCHLKGRAIMWWASCSTVMAVTALLLTLKFGAYWPVYLGTHWHFAGAERDSGVLCTSAEAWEGCCVFWIFANKSRPPSLLAGHGAGTGSKSSKLLPGTLASRVTWLSCHPIMCLWIVSGIIVLWVLRCDFLIPLIFLRKFKSSC
jgi:hypothetical protein